MNNNGQDMIKKIGVLTSIQNTKVENKESGLPIKFTPIWSLLFLLILITLFTTLYFANNYH